MMISSNNFLNVANLQDLSLLSFDNKFMKKISINLITIFCCLFVFSFAVNAQKYGSSNVSEGIKQMSKLAFLEGEWEGIGWRMSAKGERVYVKTYEKAKYKLGGSIMIIEGLGKKGNKIVHNGFAFIKYDEKQKSIVLKAYSKNGNSLEMLPKVSENKVIWGFKLPSGGQTRFTVVLNEKGNWLEIGEYSRDGGKTWIKTLEMELSKVGSKKKIANLEAKRAAAMKKLDFLIGSWKGKGWIIGQNGRQTFTVKESLKRKLNGQIVVVDGLGKSVDKKTGKERIVHQAYGVFSYDANVDKIKFRWYKAETGEEDETTIDVSNNKLVWGFDIPQSGVKVKFTEIINEKGNWLEIGEVTRDGGKTWFKFFEMELEKVDKNND